MPAVPNQNDKKSILDEATDLQHQIKTYQRIAERAPEPTRAACMAWLEQASAIIALPQDDQRPLGYSKFDLAWSAVREARHELCLVAQHQDLSRIAVDLRSDLLYVADETEKKALQDQCRSIESSLRGELLPALDQTRRALHGLSLIAGAERQTHWYRVNLLRTRLEMTAAFLAVVGILLIWAIVQKPGLFGIPVDDKYLVLLVAGFGALGGCVSVLFRRKTLIGTSAAVHVEHVLKALRPILGAAAALVLYLMQIAGLPILSVKPSPAVSCFIGFLGGFSEMFFLKNLHLLVQGKDSRQESQA